MNENRVYSKKIDIDTEHTRSFYDERALRSENMACPYTAVLLGDQSANRAEKWDKHEKSFLLSEIEFNKNDVILDIGCGMGRLAEILIPLCGYYTGVDFSSEMIKLAKKRCGYSEEKNFDFINSSFSEIVNAPVKISKKVTKLIITGVCMYINDKELKECYSGIIKYLDKNCTLYIEDTVAIETRLTLDNIKSDSLQSNYDAIYRTPSEYNDFFKVFEQAGFNKIKQGFFPNFDDDDSFKETDHWYTILKSNSNT